MKFPRRKFLHLVAGATALSVVSRIASADTYPSRPVHLIIGFPPGGASDAVARLVGQWLSERCGQPFVIENRPGASTTIGTEAVVRAAADGYRRHGKVGQGGPGGEHQAGVDRSPAPDIP